MLFRSPERYSDILRDLAKYEGEVSLELKEELVKEAFALTARYDAAIAFYLSGAKDSEIFPKKLDLGFEKIQDLRYGENPHQKAAFYKLEGGGLSDAIQLQGKELSFNNILDMEAAFGLVSYFFNPTVSIIKHNNPCGVATSKNLIDAYLKAYKCDKVSAFGGIVAANRAVDGKTAKEISKIFVEVVIAPDFSDEALSVFSAKKNLRIVRCPLPKGYAAKAVFDFKKVSGGVLLQERDAAELSMSDITVKTKKQPSLHEMEDLFFAWGVCKFVKSNAIVIVRDGATVGIGAGQMNRVGSADIALKQAGSLAKGSVIASDGFLPFPDTVEIAAKSKISAVIQPGGSVNDQLVIDAANKNKMAMVFTGRRHFRH